MILSLLTSESTQGGPFSELRPAWPHLRCRLWKSPLNAILVAWFLNFKPERKICQVSTEIPQWKSKTPLSQSAPGKAQSTVNPPPCEVSGGLVNFSRLTRNISRRHTNATIQNANYFYELQLDSKLHKVHFLHNTSRLRKKIASQRHVTIWPFVRLRVDSMATLHWERVAFTGFGAGD